MQQLLVRAGPRRGGSRIEAVVVGAVAMTAVEDVRSRRRDPLPAHHQSAKPYLIGEATKSGVAGLQSGESWSR